jgi:putative peptidoglycan lipid II flippase
MSAAVFLSRILGLVREQVFAYFFGAGLASDAYLVAFRIPNLFRDLLAEGALSSAFVTVFSRARDPMRSKELARNVLAAIALVVGILCVALFVFSPQLVHWMAEDFATTPGKLELTNELARVLSPFLFFVSSAALAMGILNSLGHFFIPSMGSAAFNLGNILVGGLLCWFYRDQGQVKMIWGFAVGSLVGGAAQWLIQWPLLRKEGYRPWAGVTALFSRRSLKSAFSDSGLQKIFALMAPSILSVAVVQINVMVITIVATGLPQGSVTWLNFAYRLLHFPLGVFGVALSTAALPNFARLIYDKKIGEFNQALQTAIRYTWILAFGSAAGLFVFRDPLVSLFYEHGRFTSADTVATGWALAAFVIGLPSMNATKILAQAYYAIDRVWIPSVVSVVLLIIHYFLAVTLAAKWGHTGLAATTAGVSILNSLILGIVLRFLGYKLVSGESLRVFAGILFGTLLILSLEKTGLAPWLLSFRKTSTLQFAGLTLLSIGVVGGAYLAWIAVISSEGRRMFQRIYKKLLRA